MPSETNPGAPAIAAGAVPFPPVPPRGIVPMTDRDQDRDRDRDQDREQAADQGGHARLIRMALGMDMDVKNGFGQSPGRSRAKARLAVFMEGHPDVGMWAEPVRTPDGRPAWRLREHEADYRWRVFVVTAGPEPACDCRSPRRPCVHVRSLRSVGLLPSAGGGPLS